MEGKSILVGDHTGLIKFFNPKLTILGSSGPDRSVLNLLTKDEAFYAIRLNGVIEEFDLNNNFKQLRPASKKILDGALIDDKFLIAYKDGHYELETQSCKTGMSSCRGISSNQNLLSLCGDSKAEIWDINTNKLYWKCKTPKAVEEVHDSKCLLKGNYLYTATINNEIKLYDTRTGKKPSLYTRLNPEGHIYNYPISAIFIDDGLIYVGDAIGHVYKLDGALKVLGKTKGRSVGAIQSIFVKENLLYSCGLDRRLMIHDAKSMKLIDKQYLWQKLTKVIVF
jgi:WD40 repeat protein